ncbi:recombination protein RecO [Sulfurimonas sp. HSL-1716]|uniref:recombination protein RecO n=1 Tax=Hydrocurvibacter sulfurireducens TaxID=3131937 RepID=UPI0031F73BED
MQGYIININRAKDEDLIVTIISKDNLQIVYRFYGARHGVINLGFKIDYELEGSIKSSISRLRDVIHLSFKWISDRNRLRAWQDFVTLFHQHLKQAEDIGDFYFNLIDDAAMKWDRQNPKRVAVEAYSRLLRYEGRLHRENRCFLCSQKIEKEISVIRGYLPTHFECSHTLGIDKDALNELFDTHSSLFLSDKEIDRLWYVLLEGL